ncbi:MAG: glycosyltransferase family 39 protein [Leptolyngbyaceae bacterium]|nr:glycosyltransferase family 39 protein [Leptolyngbyaceae bacterium]
MTNQLLPRRQRRRVTQSERAIAPHPRQRLLTTLSIVLIGIGILLRVMQFASGRSLWADEAKLALNILDRSYLELTQVLDYDQVAPIGFLWVEKLATQLLSNAEVALRIFPFAASIASLVLICQIARRYLHPVGVPIAIALFALHAREIYYSSEIKQYSSDVMVALLLVAVIYSPSPLLTRRQIWLFSGVGAIAVWLSHPSIFILASLALTQILSQIIRTIRDKKAFQLGAWVPVYGAWAVSFLAFYFLSVSENSGNDTLLTSWASRRAFPAGFPDLDWLFYSLKRLFWKPLDFPKPFFDKVAIAACLAGIVSLARRKGEAVGLLLLPLVMTLVAAYLHKYPFYSRVILFLIPFMALLMAQGVAWLITLRVEIPNLRSTWTRIAASFLGCIWVGLLLYVPAAKAQAYLTPPVTDEEIKPVMAYIEENWQSGDLIYVFQKSQFQFEFYREQYGFDADEYVVGVDPDAYVETDFGKVKRLYRQNLRQFCGRDRLWVLISDLKIRPQTEFMLERLDQWGDRRDSFEVDALASSVYLYDLGQCSGK